VVAEPEWRSEREEAQGKRLATLAREAGVEPFCRFWKRAVRTS
jgi:hypothetical protein